MKKKDNRVQTGFRLDPELKRQFEVKLAQEGLEATTFLTGQIIKWLGGQVEHVPIPETGTGRYDTLIETALENNPVMAKSCLAFLKGLSEPGGAAPPSPANETGKRKGKRPGGRRQGDA